MRRMLASAVLLGLPMLGSAQTQFSTQVVPILRMHCVGCHMTGEEPGNLQLHPGKAYQSLVGVQAKSAPLPRVDPGSVSTSYLLHKLKGTHLDAEGDGVRMPFGMPALPDTDLEIISDWIEEGAPNN